METRRRLPSSAVCLLLLAAVTICSTNAQTDANQSQPESQSPPPPNTEMTPSTEGPSVMMVNGSSQAEMTTMMAMEAASTSAASTGMNDQAILIGNGSQPPLQVDSSMPAADSSSQSTNQSDSNMSTTTTTTTTTEVKSNPTSTEPTPSPSERTVMPEMNTSPWLPGKFPPPGVGSESEEGKNTGSGAPGTGSTIEIGGSNNNNNDANLNKSHYDIFQAHEPAKADETSTFSGALSGMDATMGSSKEVSMDNSAKSNRRQQDQGNGGSRVTRGCWATVLYSIATLVIILIASV